MLQIKLTKALPTAGTVTDPTKEPPWAIRLRSGRWCEFSVGANGEVGGRRLNYFCGPGGGGDPSGGYLIGDPNRGSAVWTIDYASNPKHPGSYKRVAIASVWW